MLCVCESFLGEGSRVPNYNTFNLNPAEFQTSIYGQDGTGTLRPVLTDTAGRVEVVGNLSVTSIESATVTTILGGTLNVVDQVTTVNAINGATVTTIQGGTLNVVNQVTTVNAINGATVTTIQGGTLNVVNTVNAVNGATVTTIQGGTLNVVNQVTTVNAINGATVTTIQGGTLNTVNQVTTVVAISQQNFVESNALNIPVTTTNYTPIPSATLSRVTEYYDIYTYFVKNQTGNTVNILLEISPNDTDYYPDTEITNIVNTVVPVTPKYFMKYTRVSYKVTSGSSTIDVWFNAQG